MPGVTWDQLFSMTAGEIQERDIFPRGFMPVPHPNHPEEEMLFPQFLIDEVTQQEDRNVTRFDPESMFPATSCRNFPLQYVYCRKGACGRANLYFESEGDDSNA